MNPASQNLPARNMGHACAVAASFMLVISSLVLITPAPEFSAARAVAYANVVGGVLVASLVSQLAQARRVFGVLAVVLVVLNLGAVLAGVHSWWLIGNAVWLVIAAVLVSRQEVSEVV